MPLLLRDMSAVGLIPLATVAAAKAAAATAGAATNIAPAACGEPYAGAACCGSR